MNEIITKETGPELYRLHFLPCPEECLMGWGNSISKDGSVAVN